MCLRSSHRLSLTVMVLAMFCIQSHATALPHRLINGQATPSLAPAVDAVAPAVVNVATYTTVKRYNPLLSSPFFRHFFDIPESFEEQRQSTSAGSGVIVDAQQGYIITNHHVVEGADEIEVNLRDGRRISARLIGSDKKVDIALLQVNADKLTQVQLSDSSKLRVGDFVLAIGNPFGLGQTVTSGIVSALGRNGLGIQGYEDFIQTDASINPGNSGGALVDLQGKLVGINSAIIAPAGGNVGIGFAIPIEVALSVKEQLIQFGRVRRGGIGASFQDLTPDLAEAFELDRFQGALVSDIREGGEAQRAGLLAGDIIIRANQRPVANANDIINRIGLLPIGATLTLAILRDGKERVVEMNVKAIPVPQIQGAELAPMLQGALLKDYIAQDQESAMGIIVEELDADSPASQLGLQESDLIYGLNRTRVRSIADFKQVAKREQPYIMRIRRGYSDLLVYLR